MKYQCNVCGGDACRTGFLGDDLIPERCPYNSDFVPEWRPVKYALNEERGAEGPRPGDIVAWKRKDGQEFITPCYCKENEPFISPKNWRRVILMRRAEVERLIEKAGI